MNDQKANYQIVQITGSRVVIRDMGPWDKYMTVTNAAESVVKELYERGVLGNKELHYYGSDGDFDQLDHDGKGGFTGFSTGVFT